jgi:predicted ribosome quality control (RQC) complex YloA/Tae2 family protein
MKTLTRNSINFIVGQSAQENWKIILKSARNYHWVHADGIPSAHVIIETDDPFEEDIAYACNLCAEQTKIANNKNQLYIISPVSNIKLGATPGEVIIRDEAKASYYLSKAREQTK